MEKEEGHVFLQVLKSGTRSLTLVPLWWEDGRSRSTVLPCFGAESQEIKHRDVSSRTKLLKIDEWSDGRQVNHKMSFHGVAEWNNKPWRRLKMYCLAKC